MLSLVSRRKGKVYTCEVACKSSGLEFVCTHVYKLFVTKHDTKLQNGSRRFSYRQLCSFKKIEWPFTDLGMNVTPP